MYLNKVFYKGGEYMRQWTSATGVCIHAEKRERSNYENTYCDRSSQRNCLRWMHQVFNKACELQAYTKHSAKAHRLFNQLSVFAVLLEKPLVTSHSSLQAPQCSILKHPLPQIWDAFNCKAVENFSWHKFVMWNNSGMDKKLKLQINNCRQQPSDCLGLQLPFQQSGGFCL